MRIRKILVDINEANLFIDSIKLANINIVSYTFTDLKERGILVIVVVGGKPMFSH